MLFMTALQKHFCLTAFDQLMELCKTRSDGLKEWSFSLHKFIYAAQKTNDQNDHYIPECSDQKCI